MVVGGGPAASFFAIRALRKARELGKTLDLIIIERKTEVCFYEPLGQRSWEGCTYCAGGISPRLADALEENAIHLPEEIIEGRASEVIVHGDWKNIELAVPEGRSMYSAFRGSRPHQRPNRYANLDSFLLSVAEQEGARVLAAELRDIRRSSTGRPVVSYRVMAEDEDREAEAELVVVAAGVNRKPGMDLGSDPVFAALAKVMPGLRPPKVRKAVIACMQAPEGGLRAMEGEVHFAQHGSKELAIEMCSLIPKGDFMTVVLMGKSIDRAGPPQYMQIARDYMALPHIARLLPSGARLQIGCACAPSMVVGAARHPVVDRIALVGDMAVSRLYKDGLYSAYVTGSALAECVLTEGVDRESLVRRYWPVVKDFDVDNRSGRGVFLLSRIVFSRPLLSRIVYQALVTERKTKPAQKRRMTDALWDMASGDSSYRRILRAMFHPASIESMVVGGLLVTVRNYGTEQVFGLKWGEFGRYPTGVAIEAVDDKRREISSVLGVGEPDHRPQMENMYSIRIRADAAAILRQLSKFGDADRQYFKPRFIKVSRTEGEANEVGSVVHYQVTPSWLSFSVVLEKVVEGRYLLYRVMDGFARGGSLVFDVDPLRMGVNLLSIYVGFDFPRGRSRVGKLGWRLGRAIFPGFVHDVVWNHSLCRLKDVVESDAREADEAHEDEALAAAPAVSGSD